MKNLKLVSGIELETEYNSDLLNFNKSNYKSSQINFFNDEFIAEVDGSLNPNKFGYNSEITELISLPFIVNQKSLTKVLKNFKKSVYTKISEKKGISYKHALKKYKFKDIFNFNKSMGSHVHISVINEDIDNIETIELREDNLINFNGSFIPLVNYLDLDYINKKFKSGLFKEIRKVIPDSFNLFEKQYLRSYAKQNKMIFGDSRSTSFNIINNSHIEIRSLNLNGVTTWLQFENIIFCFYDTIIKYFLKELSEDNAFLFKKNLKYEFPENFIEKIEIKEVLEFNKTEVLKCVI